MNHQKILTINFGSSSVKAAYFSINQKPRKFFYSHMNEVAIEYLADELRQESIDCIGHRIVHGGPIKDPIRLINTLEYERLTSLLPLAPFHMENCLLGVDQCLQFFTVPQYACFDTAFHWSMPELARRLPVPADWQVERYGFHGLNYAYIAKILPALIAQQAYGYVVIAHLGSGSSLCLLHNLKSIDTTMGLTPLGGVTMSTRTGDIDPGVIISQFMHETDITELTKKLYKNCGLLALSNNLSSDIKTLLTLNNADSQFAIDYYCQNIRAAIGAFAAKTGHIDALVFTGGVGEHSIKIRSNICDKLELLGFVLDKNLNQTHQTFINVPGFKPILCIPANEEEMIYDLVKNYESL